MFAPPLLIMVAIYHFQQRWRSQSTVESFNKYIFSTSSCLYAPYVKEEV